MALSWQKYVPVLMAVQYDGTNGEEIMSVISASNVTVDEEGTFTFDDERDSGRQLFVGNWAIVDGQMPSVGIEDNPPWIEHFHISTSPSVFYASDTTEDYV